MNKSIIIFTSTALLIGLMIGRLISFPQHRENNHFMSFCVGDDDIVFSCAMHPQIQQTKRAKCPICGMRLTSNQGSKYLEEAMVSMTPLSAALAQIETATVTYTSTLEKAIQISGIVQPDESRVFQQIAHLPGRIEKLYINESGVFIRKGQRIASMYSKELIAVIEAFEYSKNSNSVLRSAENNLKAWKITKEQLENFDVKKGEHHKSVDVYADFSGFILKKLAKEGSYAVNTHMGAPTTFFEIADLSKVWVLFDLPEQDLNWAKKGDVIQFSVSAFPEKIFSGTIQVVEPTVDMTTRSIKLRLEVDNTDLLLKPGMLAEGAIKVRRSLEKPKLYIPESAVLWTGASSVVYIKSQDHEVPVFAYREVQLGHKLDGHYLVESGLEAGEAIVTNGAIKVDATAQLNRKRSIF